MDQIAAVRNVLDQVGRIETMPREFLPMVFHQFLNHIDTGIFQIGMLVQNQWHPGHIAAGGVKHGLNPVVGDNGR